MYLDEQTNLCLLTSVNSFMLCQATVLICSVFTLITSKRLLTSMDSVVSFEFRNVIAFVFTLITSKGLFTSVDSFMFLELITVCTFEITLVTLIWLFACVSSLMSDQCAFYTYFVITFTVKLHFDILFYHTEITFLNKFRIICRCDINFTNLKCIICFFIFHFDINITAFQIITVQNSCKSQHFKNLINLLNLFRTQII